MIIYFSGTGNSQFIASILAERTNQSIVSMNEMMKGNRRLSVKNEPSITIVSPIYAGRIPRVVADCIEAAELPNGIKTYFVATCEDSMANADRYAKKLCIRKNIEFYGMAEIKMPEGYIVMFTAPDDDKAKSLIEAGKQQASALAQWITSGKPFAEAQGKWSAMSHLLNPIFYKAIISAKGFHVGSDCVGCASCVNACPLNNIKLESGMPKWGKDCTHCMACISNCPKQTIEYGKKTIDKKRYHINKMTN
ncbi:MAG: EFR1 family ferrodoxin [Christensenellaceae bacterium]